MLSMAFFKSLVKHHGKTFFEPVGKALAAAGIKKPNPFNPAHAWALKAVAWPYLKWRAGRQLMPIAKSQLPTMSPPLRKHAEFACEQMQRMSLEISAAMSKFQLSLADRQCRMSELSGRCQNLIVILCTSLYGARQTDPLIAETADLFCQKQTDAYLGRRAANAYFRQITALGEAIAAGKYQPIAGLDPDEIMMKYDPQT